MSLNYSIKHILEQLNIKGYTNFVNPLEFMMLKKYVSFKDIKVYEMYNDCTKKIIYRNEKPIIKLVKIVGKRELRHQEVLKECFVLGLKEDTYGDIVIQQGCAFIYLLPKIMDYFIYNFKSNSTEKFELSEVPLSYLDSYCVKYMELNFIVTSLRIDKVISCIVKTSRKDILEKFKNKDIVLNYQTVVKYFINLKEGDIFSIRKFGKYKFDSIVKVTKKNNYVIKILKYI